MTNPHAFSGAFLGFESCRGDDERPDSFYFFYIAEAVIATRNKSINGMGRVLIYCCCVLAQHGVLNQPHPSSLSCLLDKCSKLLFVFCVGCYWLAVQGGAGAP